MDEAAAIRLRAVVDQIEELAERRLGTTPRPGPAAARARQLADLARTHLRIRARSLEAPLVVVLLGSTGAGKSSLFNSIVGRPASRTGVLRPTTREAIVLVHPDDRPSVVEGPFADLGDRIRIVEEAGIEPGLAVVDSPDLDSIEHGNRELADRLVEAADLAIFVTTATRYADRVPWDVLGRVRARGLPLIVVVNRVPATGSEREDLLADVARLFVEAGMAETFDATAPQGGSIALVAIADGAIDRESESIVGSAVVPITERIADLRGDRNARIEVAARALAGSLRGLVPDLDAIADDCEHEAIDADALRRSAENRFERELVALREELERGTFLREEALRHWQSFVGADQITRFFSTGIGRLRGAISAFVRPARAPVAEVRAATTEDLAAAARIRAAEAARLTASAWSTEPAVNAAIDADPALWGASPDFDDRIARRLTAWIDGIAAEIQATGRPKRVLAQGASLGVNAVGTGVMLATFLHTGGLTGAEIGVAAGTAFLNQKLLGALFGEAAMAELISSAHRRLDEALATTFGEELARFERLVPAGGDLNGLARGFRAAAAEVRELPAGLPHEMRDAMAAATKPSS